jgi:beta-glucosidase
MKTTLHPLVPALLALALIGPARCLGHSAVEPVPRPDEWWKNRHESMNATSARLGEQAQIIFIGDSITQGWEGAGREVWTRYYAPREAINLGIGGDRTQHVLWRLDNGNLEGLKPKVAVVMIGTNNSNGDDNAVEQIADGVTAIVRKLRERLPDTKVLLLAIFPRNENPTAQRGKILQVNQIIRKLADGQNVFWADFGHKFIRPDGSIPRDLMPDFLHLSSAGYEVWAESIEPRLVRLLGESASPTRSASDLTGNWVAILPGPQGEPVELPFQLRQNGRQLIGQFQRSEGRSLPIENGSVQDNEFSWTVRRERPDGSTMVYRMSGRLEDDQIKGKATAEGDDDPRTIEWTAKRR